MKAAFKLAEDEGLALETSIKFEPFQLDPSLPLDQSLDKRTHLAKKFGADRLPMMEAQMKARGAPHGIAFSYDGKLRQTISAHRLLAKAYETGGQKIQLALNELLFRGYFEEQADIGSEDFLAGCAVKVGVFADVEAAKSFLASDEGVSQYWAQIKRAQRQGISGVPFFILNERFAVPGAVEPDDFLRAIKQTIDAE